MQPNQGFLMQLNQVPNPTPTRGRHSDWIAGLDCRIGLDRIRFWQSEAWLRIGLD